MSTKTSDEGMCVQDKAQAAPEYRITPIHKGSTTSKIVLRESWYNEVMLDIIQCLFHILLPLNMYRPSFPVYIIRVQFPRLQCDAIPSEGAESKV